VHELLVVTPEVKRLIHRRATVEDLLSAAIPYGMTTLGQDGIGKILNGWTEPGAGWSRSATPLAGSPSCC